MGTVNAISNTQPVPPVAVTNANGVNGFSTYQQLLALQSENQLLGINQNANDNGLLTADLLDLSPVALNILNGIETTSQLNGTNGLLNITGTVNGAITTLTPAQQQQVAAVVAQFANQPLTQDTFTQIENALTAQGINPQELSIQQLLGAYAYAFTPGLAFNGQLFTDTLASDLSNA